MQLHSLQSLNPEEMRKAQCALQYLHRHYTESISAYQLSIEMNLRPEKIQAGFRLLTGSSVHQYLLQYRVDQAKIKLEDFSISIKQIAYKTGFSTTSLFIHHFKTLTGQTPRQFRSQWLSSRRLLPPSTFSQKISTGI